MKRGKLSDMKAVSIAEILTLDIPERIRLAEDIWDSIAEVPQSIRLTRDQQQELDKRLAAYRLDPSQGSPWEEVKKRIRNNA